MKLLCWMHRKFRQNSHEALKALVMGQSSVDDQQYFPKVLTSGGGRGFKQAPQQLRNSFTGVVVSDSDVIDDVYADELFHGFLAIGTLGGDHNGHVATTPTFAISVDNIIAEKEAEATTENDLRLINDELEKVLLLDDGDAASRNSHVSAGRSSHGSVITLSGKPDDSSAGGPVCPLQGYLFGSAIEMSATTAAGIRKDTGAAAAAGGRTSLGELFQRSKMADSGDETKRILSPAAEKDAGDYKSTTTAMNLVKKKLKKKMLHASSRSSNSGGSDSSAPSTETKLHKILHMFHRKVHPETSSEGTVKAAAGNHNNKAPQKNELRKKTVHDGSFNNEEGQTAPDEDMTLCPQRALFLKQKIRRYRSQSNPPQFTFGSIDCNGNREQWIKTDADYLVLEL